MRPRSLMRFLGLPAAAVGLAAAVATAAPDVAHAQTLNVNPSGTLTVTIPDSYIVALAKAGIVEFPLPASELSASSPDQTVTVTFNVTGGTADISVFSGQMDLSGSLVVAGVHGVVKFRSLVFDIQDGYIEATPAGSSTPVPLFDPEGSRTASFLPTDTTGLDFADTFTASDLEVDPAGAAFLNNALHTSAFQAGQDVGSLSSAWAVAYPD